MGHLKHSRLLCPPVRAGEAERSRSQVIIMKSSRPACRPITFFGTVFIASHLLGLLCSGLPLVARGQTPSADTTGTPTPTPTPAPNNSSVSSEASSPPAQAASKKEWREWMAKHPAPKDGCFKATYPKMKWKKVPCGPPPKKTYPPAQPK